MSKRSSKLFDVMMSLSRTIFDCFVIVQVRSDATYVPQIRVVCLGAVQVQMH